MIYVLTLQKFACNRFANLELHDINPQKESSRLFSSWLICRGFSLFGVPICMSHLNSQPFVLQS